MDIPLSSSLSPTLLQDICRNAAHPELVEASIDSAGGGPTAGLFSLEAELKQLKEAEDEAIATLADVKATIQGVTARISNLKASRLAHEKAHVKPVVIAKPPPVQASLSTSTTTTETAYGRSSSKQSEANENNNHKLASNLLEISRDADHPDLVQQAIEEAGGGFGAQHFELEAELTKLREKEEEQNKEVQNLIHQLTRYQNEQRDALTELRNNERLKTSIQNDLERACVNKKDDEKDARVAEYEWKLHGVEKKLKETYEKQELIDKNIDSTEVEIESNKSNLRDIEAIILGVRMRMIYAEKNSKAVKTTELAAADNKIKNHLPSPPPPSSQAAVQAAVTAQVNRSHHEGIEAEAEAKAQKCIDDGTLEEACITLKEISGSFNKFTPLGAAAVHNDVALVKALLKVGADVNNNKSGACETALMLAVIKGHRSLVAFLLTVSGCDANTSNYMGGSAYGMAEDQVIKEMLKDAGANTKSWW